MISVSSEYKEIMSRPIRNRAYISVGIGVVNQEAQASGEVNGDFAYWSYGDVFNANQPKIEYATLEENFMIADGSQYFVPENDELIQLQTNGITTSGLMGEVRIDFQNICAIKGLTLNFGSSYPTAFSVETAEKTLEYANDSEKFVTTDVLGDTDYIVIEPTSMVGGKQRLRIRSVLIGVGLQYGNRQTKSFNIDEYASPISEDLPSDSISFTFYDEEEYFDVDDDNSFVDFLETMQRVSVSFGVELDSGSVEWHQIATGYLNDWKSQKGVVTISATDRLAQMEDEYSLANRIYDRTAYEEVESIFADAGLEPDEYYIDEYLEDVMLHNPMPGGSHKECLQTLANACRCIIKQDPNGVIMVVANFAIVVDPEDLSVETNGTAAWSNPDSILTGSGIAYAEMTRDFLTADGTMYFLPEPGEGENYLDVAYASELISDSDGLFEANPTITIGLPAAYTYYGVEIDFGGNSPQEMIIHTYKNEKLRESTKFTNLTNESVLIHDFWSFDKMVFEFTRSHPNNRILVNRISFGSLTDYTLEYIHRLEHPIGYKEKRVKETRCKVYTYIDGEDGEPEEVEDEVFASVTFGDVGEIKTIQNPLVSTTEHARTLAEWVGNYYANNISYSVKYSGEPRIGSGDIIRMQNDKKNNLQAEITRSKLSFSGKFSGELELRKAMKLNGGD